MMNSNTTQMISGQGLRGLLLAGLGFLALKYWRQQLSERRQLAAVKARRHEAVDRASMDSFPASDPPSTY